MKKPPCYRFYRRGRKAGIVIQIRDPQTRELIDAADLAPFRSRVEVATPAGKFPARTLLLLTEETAAGMAHKLEPLPDIAEKLSQG